MAKGYSDANPPPKHKLGSIDHYVRRIKAEPPDNPRGAAWRLCTIKQPRSVEELVRSIWPAGNPPGGVGGLVIDEYSEWVAAGKPAVHVPR